MADIMAEPTEHNGKNIFFIEDVEVGGHCAEQEARMHNYG